MMHEAPLVVRYREMVTDMVKNNVADMALKILLIVGRMDIGRYPVTEFFKASLLG